MQLEVLYTMLERPPVATAKEDLEAYAFALNSTVRHLMEKINAEYLYWDQVKYLTKEDPSTNRMLWFAVKKLRMFNYKHIQFGHYSFRYILTNEILGLLHELDMGIGGTLSAESIIPAQDKNKYLMRSIMEEAIASSQMEGASTTRKVAKEMLRKNDKPQNKGQQMILNNYQTINYIKDIAQTDFALERLKEAHRLMTVNTLDNANEEGVIRKNDNILVLDGITGSIAHNPPPFTEVDELLNDLEVFFNKSGDYFIHPILKGIIIHFMLAYIHPFSDGNGRTARSLFYWYLIKQGYWMMEYLSISRIIYKSKRQYEKAFLCTEYDENDLTYFILYHLKTMKNAFEELKLYLKRKTEESNSISLITQIQGINLRQAQILDIITKSPTMILTVKEIENRFAVSNQTAKTNLAQLVQL
ncbi:Adenosine monophosphate-protein transferase SoFic [termite gut metagenome]|uniref:Adenosine monophosphate-protein transferase SoFic n=1 Tax=termite gut metagenome TaxID=433724 RepID=A0A5J4Q261_9ZZZZ